MSSKLYFCDLARVISPYFDLVKTFTPFLSNVAKASFSPIPNFPIT